MINTVEDPTSTQSVSQMTSDHRGIPFSRHPAAAALARLKSNPRVLRIRLIVPDDACPACQQLEGDYDKDRVAELPTLSCSHPLGCRSFYEPLLSEIYP